jgi:hypothetical protein
MKLIFTTFLMLIWINICVAQEYLLTTYEKQADSTTYSLYVEKIDLAQKAAIEKIRLCDGGQLHDRKPYVFNKNTHKYYAVFVQYGFWSGSSDPQRVIYFILDDSLNISKRVEMPSAIFMGAYSFDDSTLIISLYKNGTINTPIAPQYQLDDNFELQPAKDLKNADGINVPDIGRFKYLSSINKNNSPYNIYTALAGPGRWLLKLSSTHDTVVDSLPINSDTISTTIFNYHPKAQKIYMIHFNYVNYGSAPELESKAGECRIKPRLLIYDPANLSLLKALPILGYTLDDCPSGLREGYAEVLDDYLIFNFPRGRVSPGYHPAMLFIFDTRSNEATWLRVGWR